METLTTYREDRPWGDFIQFTKNSPATVKIITVKAGEATSLQRHLLRNEFWYIISGDGFVTIGNERKEVKIKDEFRVEKGVNHRIEGGSSPLVLLEISTGEFDENDIERLEDRYNRIK